MNLMKYKTFYFVFSILIILPGLVFLLLGGLKFGIDFTGGTLAEYTFVGNVNRGALNQFGEVSQSGERTYIIRTKPLEGGELTDFKNEITAKVGKFEVKREEVIASFTLEPRPGIIAAEKERPAIGISMDLVGTVVLPFPKAIYEGGLLTARLTGETAVGIVDFLKDAVMLAANFSQITGPVGIVGLVGEASALGFVHLIIFMAFISINLAIINLLPFPALDGGRLLFVIIETLKGSPIRPKVVQVLNTVGFVLLILLMVAVTYQDIARLAS